MLGTSAQVQVHRPREVADQFGIGSLSQHQDVKRVPRGGESQAQSVDQRQHREQHRHRQRDAERGHQRRRLPHHQVSQIVGQGYFHDRALQPV